MSRYIVETEFTPGIRRVVYSGDSYNRAFEVGLFWDERCNTYFRDTLMEEIMESALDRANRLFDEAIARLESEKEYMPKLRALVRRTAPWEN